MNSGDKFMTSSSHFQGVQHGTCLDVLYVTRSTRIPCGIAVNELKRCVIYLYEWGLFVLDLVVIYSFPNCCRD